jgi:serine/threonine-protein kinase
MADTDWQKVREVFDAAIRQNPEARQGYVKKACGDDTDLLAEVESLFSSFNESDEFLETPAVAHVADLIESGTKVLETGTRFAHYEIIRQIGIGGMGEVYLAKDQKLDRRVAIKILNEKFSRDEANLERFVREAKAASALNHPSILVIHEVGESEGTHYIVSEFIEGRTLREVLDQSQMSLSDVLEVAIQIANALAAAHGAHLVHRDIKPENVMVRPDGYVKVLDFGLAKLVEQENKLFLEDPRARNQTAKGLILGTVNYMSPEQAKGQQVDERTDIFSLGVVLYEMIAGRIPFAGDSKSETFANLINAEPHPLPDLATNASDEMKRIVARTLHKNKDERYQTMQAVLTDLKDLKEHLRRENKLERPSSSDSQKPTAVLRATTDGPNKQTAEAPHGFSQTIKQHQALAAIALAALLIGSIGLGYYFFYAGKTAKRGTTNEEAYRLYQQGRNLTFNRTPEGTRKAVEYFEQAIRLDPNFARAYSGLAHALIASGNLGAGLPRVEYEKAKAAVQKSLELDNKLAEGFAVSGELKFTYEWDFAGAEKDLLRALELEPKSDLAHEQYASCLVARGRFGEAIAEIKAALEIDPNSLMYQLNHGRILYQARRYDEAILQLKRVIEVNEDYAIAYAWLLLACEMKGDYAQAYEWFMKSQKKDSEHLELFQKAYETSGWQGVRRQNFELNKVKEEQKPSANYYSMARQCALMGDKEQAFAYLNKALQKHQGQLVMLNVDPPFDRLRDDSRFDELVGRVGLK